MISVVVPAYNAGEYLEECLESLRSQSLRDIEVLVINDGSTDTTPVIAKSFADRDRRFSVTTLSNGGVSRARNAGIEMARGDYITFVDADDALHPGALESMLAVVEEENAEVCVTSFSRGNKVPEFAAPVLTREIYDYPEAMRLALYQKRILNNPWGVLIKRSLLGATKRFRENTRYEDLDAFYRFYEDAAKIVYLPFPFYFYRTNSGSFINTWSKSRLDVLDVTERMARFFAEKYPELSDAALDRRYSAHFNMLLLILRHGSEEKGAFERCLNVVKEGRRRAMKDPEVRFKNKVGALLSFGGTPMLYLMSLIGR